MRLRQFPVLLAAVSAMSMSTQAMDVEHLSVVEVGAAYAHESGSWQKQEIAWRPTWILRFDSSARLTLRGQARLDAQDKLNPGQPEQPFRARYTRAGFPSEHTELELREFFWDRYVGDAFVSLGKQQIVWGQADGLRVLDVVNPLSYREFILPDIEDRRIPLWSALAEIPVQDWTAQLVWVPDSTVAESTLPVAAYSLIPDPFGDGRLEVDRPDSLADSDFGLRLSTFVNSWDLSLNYLYHTIDDPLIRFDPVRQRILADYNRSHLIGGTASRPFGDVTFRSEVGLESKQRIVHFATGTVADTDVGSYVIGLDYSGVSDWFISAQFFQTYRFSIDDDRRSEEQTTLLVRRNALNDALMLEALCIYDLNDRDSLIQLSAEYAVSTRVVLKTGADLFYGKPSGTFGRFHDESRLMAGFSVSF
ncbi:hypothetical protein FWJ25_12795 [Marinobacter salinexigens]|uniref:Porin domain-containing protein n=1 Tax=Marinobacter salinexigens TaxID=2919747 RepID=A0A5B0VGY1_9GAMM|nr:DUF1302 family protein [Marinobacter salinexigens]KAA1173349.1 hypothetical protein FWJ25_12795 [Marinobacter salinexigens]